MRGQHWFSHALAQFLVGGIFGDRNQPPQEVIRRRRTSKSFFNVDHLSRASFHEATPSFSCPFQPILGLDASLTLQIAFVSSYNLDGWHFAVIQAVLFLHVNHLHEEIERIERIGGCNVVYEEEGV